MICGIGLFKSKVKGTNKKVKIKSSSILQI